jgi:hypothetical protein
LIEQIIPSRQPLPTSVFETPIVNCRGAAVLSWPAAA